MESALSKFGLLPAEKAHPRKFPQSRCGDGVNMRKLKNTMKRAMNIVLAISMLLSVVSVGAFAADADTNPRVVSVTLSETRTFATIEFDREIEAKTTNLTGRVKISKNGGSLYSLGTGSDVSVSGKYMYITMRTAISTPKNYFSISADTLEGQTGVIKTPTFTGEEPELLEKNNVLLDDGGSTVTIKFEKPFKGYPSDDSLANGYITLARTGSSYTEVIPADDITVNGDDCEIVIYLAEPLTGNRSRFKIAAGKIQDKATGNINLADITTGYIDASKSAATPEIDYIDISDDRYTATIYFTAKIKNAYSQSGVSSSAANSLLKSHIWVSRGSSGKYETLGGADTLTVGTNYIRIKFDQSLSSSRNYIKIDERSLTDYNGNIIDEEIDTGNFTSGTSNNAVKPAYASAFLTSSTRVVIYFTTEVQRNPNITASELRSRISVSRNGSSYEQLSSYDSVSISGTMMTISLRTPLSGTNNKIKIAANTVASTSGSVLSTAVTTASLSAGSADYDEDDYYSGYPEYTSIEYYPDARRVRIYFKDDIKKVSAIDLADYIGISRNGSAYVNLSTSDQVEIYPSNAINIILAVPLEGERNRFRISSGALADYRTGYVLNDSVVTEYVSADGSASTPSAGVSDYNSGVDVLISDDFYTITLKFAEPIFNNTASLGELKEKIQLSRNGSFATLNTNDYVRLNSADGELVVILAEPIKNFYSQIKVRSGALRDVDNKTISSDILTGALGETVENVSAYIDDVPASDIVSGTSNGSSYVATISGSAAVAELEKNTKATELLVKLPAGASSGTLNISSEVAELIKRQGGTVALSCGAATYYMPMSNVESITSGSTLSITVTSAASSSTQNLSSAAGKNSFSIENPAKEFNAKIVSADGSQKAIAHKSFAKKRFMVEGIKSTNTAFTAVRIEKSGNVVPVPSATVTNGGNIYVTADTLKDGTYALISASHSFLDTPTWAVGPTNQLASRLILENATGTKINPSEAISRAETVKIISRTLGVLGDMGGTSSFFDIVSTDDYFNAVMSTVSYGIIAGYPDSTFKPANKLTREEAMTVVARALRFMNGKSVSQSPDMSTAEADNILSKFSDSATVGSWAKVDIAECVQAGVVNGDNHGKLNPKANVTRAELIQLMYNILKATGKIS